MLNLIFLKTVTCLFTPYASYIYIYIHMYRATSSRSRSNGHTGPARDSQQRLVTLEHIQDSREFRTIELLQATVSV
jgi:hypothetical protein